MGGVVIIGLPVSTRQRLEITANRRGVRIESILAGVAPDRSSFRLLPHPSQAVHNLRSCLDGYETLTEATILVLPYAVLPEQLSTELEAFKELGGVVIAPMAGEDGWPIFKKRRKGDSDKLFELALHERVIKEICPALMPSEHLAQLRANHSCLLVPESVLSECDSVASHRYEFINASADALVELLREAGNVGTLASYFEGKGLEFAQSGGSTSAVRVYRGGKVVYSAESNMHLKKGDGTTRHSAARVYFQAFQVADVYYVALLYAGPHPDGLISGEFVLSPAPATSAGA